MNAAGSQALTDRLSRVEAALGLSLLPSRYAMALDARDVDTLVGLFVDDVKAGPEGRGRDALRRWYDVIRWPADVELRAAMPQRLESWRRFWERGDAASPGRLSTSP
ncbi:hypothetical protein [Mycolicibacterium iranicum]|uniref:SnoaL-like domain-containing protein n=1 Tax=Mycolicibacterium iranicum TaxID=912594 RepID=A0A178LTF8_MYCIR|nr:hypothetical protein [Mycolicibacterium iranicum]OAN36875.1 hypothetical protein A4X20_06735 [Mycolicibacterium iranicum]